MKFRREIKESAKQTRQKRKSSSDEFIETTSTTKKKKKPPSTPMPSPTTPKDTKTCETPQLPSEHTAEHTAETPSGATVISDITSSTIQQREKFCDYRRQVQGQ